jgi:hypothetical protein
MRASQSSEPDAEAREARDVMAFGQEIGRVLSGGRILGRSEPFAKVFPSSRLVKKAVGLAAWGVLEDIALDATLDGQGRLVAETNVRRIADNLGLNKDTVTKYLRRLREYGFVLQEETRGDGSGRYESCRYVLDPSACVERFTNTPSRQVARRMEPCPKVSDTVAQLPVSEDTGHGDTGQGGFGHQQRDVVVEPSQEEQQQTTGDADSHLRRRCWTSAWRHRSPTGCSTTIHPSGCATCSTPSRFRRCAARPAGSSRPCVTAGM